MSDAAYSLWQTPEKTPTDHNCTLYLAMLKLLRFVISFFFSFITYRSCKHLDNKHTVFGKLVGGMETLLEMEKIEVDNKDRPIEDIVIVKAQVFVDPYQEADEQVSSRHLSI